MGFGPFRLSCCGECGGGGKCTPANDWPYNQYQVDQTVASYPDDVFAGNRPPYWITTAEDYVCVAEWLQPHVEVRPIFYPYATWGWVEPPVEFVERFAITATVESVGFIAGFKRAYFGPAILTWDRLFGSQPVDWRSCHSSSLASSTPIVGFFFDGLVNSWSVRWLFDEPGFNPGGGLIQLPNGPQSGDQLEFEYDGAVSTCRYNGSVLATMTSPPFAWQRCHVHGVGIVGNVPPGGFGGFTSSTWRSLGISFDS